MAKQSYLNQVQWGLVLSEAWSNNEFRQKLELDPTGTIKTYARDRLGVDLEHAFQLPPLPADLGMEALRSTGRSGNHVSGVPTVYGSGAAPGSVTGSGTAPNISAPGSVTGSGTAPSLSAPGSVTGSGTAPNTSAPGSVTGSGTSGSGVSGNS